MDKYLIVLERTETDFPHTLLMYGVVLLQVKHWQ